MSVFVSLMYSIHMQIPIPQLKRPSMYIHVCNKYPSNILLVCLLYFCHQILPSAVDMLREFPGQNLRISLPCIQFIYWALIHVENCAGQQVIKHLLNLVVNEMANLASFNN